MPVGLHREDPRSESVKEFIDLFIGPESLIVESAKYAPAQGFFHGCELEHVGDVVVSGYPGLGRAGYRAPSRAPLRGR